MGDSSDSVEWTSQWVVGALICPHHRRLLFPLSIYTTVCLLSISLRRDAPRWMQETSCCVSPPGRARLYCTHLVHLTWRSPQHIHQHRNQQDNCAPVFERNCLCSSLSLIIHRRVCCPFTAFRSWLLYKMTRRHSSISLVVHCSLLSSVVLLVVR